MSFAAAQTVRILLGKGFQQICWWTKTHAVFYGVTRLTADGGIAALKEICCWWCKLRSPLALLADPGVMPPKLPRNWAGVGWDVNRWLIDRPSDLKPPTDWLRPTEASCCVPAWLGSPRDGTDSDAAASVFQQSRCKIPRLDLSKLWNSNERSRCVLHLAILTCSRCNIHYEYQSLGSLQL